MILAAIYPEKFDGEKGLNLMKVGFVPLLTNRISFLVSYVRSIILFCV